MSASRNLRRRCFSAEFKQSLVQASREEGASIAGVSIRHDVNPNLLQRWVKEFEAGVVWRDSAERTGVRYSAQTKQSIVEQCLRPGETVSVIALAHGISPKVVHHWVRQARQERASGFLSVQVREELPAFPVVAAAPTLTPAIEAAPGEIEIELNGARLKFQGEVTLQVLRVVMDALTK
jgi:transposase-like protein